MKTELLGPQNLRTASIPKGSYTFRPPTAEEEARLTEALNEYFNNPAHSATIRSIFRDEEEPDAT